MNRRCLPAILAISMFSAGPARADKRLITESRHPTALENRRARAKVAEKLEADGFRPMPRIVGGRAAADGEYPWMVGLLDAAEDDRYDAFYCGASLIHPRWVLTAAHCVTGSRAEDIEVLVGATDLDDPASGQRIAVAEIIVSPDYNDFTMDSDFALLRLAEAAEGTVLPVLDDPALALPGVETTITGWGDTTNGNGNFPTRLQEVEIPLVDLALANASPSYAGTLTGNMLAAGLAQGGKDTCSGDSGGPLLVPSPLSPGWMLGWVVSFGDQCAQPGVFGIYTRIGNFRDFIISHLMPNYAAWERANGLVGEGRDPDGNGFTNFEDFALPEQELVSNESGSTLFLSYVRPEVAPEASYLLESAPDESGPWSPAALAFHGDVSHGAGLVRLTYRVQVADAAGAYRVRAVPSGADVPGPRPLDFPGGARGRLKPYEEGRVYRLGPTPPGATLAVTLRSGDFDAQLTITEVSLADGSSGFAPVIPSNQGGGANGTDERYELFPKTGYEYHLGVESFTAGTGGEYELNVWEPAALAAVPVLAVPRRTPLAGTLVAGDPLDPFFLPGGTYHKDDYRLDTAALPAGSMVELRMKSSGAAARGIDDFLSLIDAESGRFITANDNFAGRTNDAGLRFMPVSGRSYILRATSGTESDFGTYSLTSATPVLSVRSPLATLAIGASAAGRLGVANEIDGTYLTFKRDYLLAPALAGQKLFATLASTKFDAYLIVLDAADLSVVTEGDLNGPPGGLDNARAEFTPRAGHRYLVRATSYSPGQAGAYTLATGVAP